MHNKAAGLFARLFSGSFVYNAVFLDNRSCEHANLYSSKWLNENVFVTFTIHSHSACIKDA